MSYDRRTLASDSPWAIVASLLMIFAAVMILAIIPSRLQGADEWGLAVSLLPLLPSAACICTAVMLVSRKNSLIPTAVPVAAVCFFIAASVLASIPPLPMMIRTPVFAMKSGS